ncbi:MAG: hypothetical protein ACQEQL_09305, partial [Pseudomonadota bacterium]
SIMKKFIGYLLSRLRERSSWLGIISVLTAVGVSLSPEQTQAVVSAGVALAGAIAVFTSDQEKQ